MDENIPDIRANKLVFQAHFGILSVFRFRGVALGRHKIILHCVGSSIDQKYRVEG